MTSSKAHYRLTLSKKDRRNTKEPRSGAAHDQRAMRLRTCQRDLEVVATGGLRWKAGRISPTQQAQPAPLP